MKGSHKYPKFQSIELTTLPFFRPVEIHELRNERHRLRGHHALLHRPRPRRRQRGGMRLLLAAVQCSKVKALHSDPSAWLRNVHAFRLTYCDGLWIPALPGGFCSLSMRSEHHLSPTQPSAQLIAQLGTPAHMRTNPTTQTLINE